MPRDSELLAHRDWLGYLQPVGLVVSPPALLEAQAYVDRNVFDLQQRFAEHVRAVPVFGHADPVPAVLDLPALLIDVFGWRREDLVGGDALPANLEAPLPEFHETLRPTFAVPAFGPGADQPSWLLLIQQLATGTPPDDAGPASSDRRWHASPQARFERLLRETSVPIGLLCIGTHLRLVYAPRGESSGHVTFPVSAMTEVAGRPILAALHMLLCEARLFSLPEKQRLPAILSNSRRFQNMVSVALSGQVLEALYELLRGFQAADDQSKGELLRDVLAHDPDAVYRGLLTVLLRLVFLLYAEDKGGMSADEIYVRHYSVTDLFEQLRGDAGRYADTMDQRYGAWCRLLTLFRLVHDGAAHGTFRLPERRGGLFDPDRYPFLEGRPHGSARQEGERLCPPLVPDGVVYRVLDKLLLLDGERLAYRALSVHHLGSVYETMMGFRPETVRGRSITVRPARAHGAPTTVDLDELLTVAAAKRNDWLKERTDQSLTGAALTALRAARTPSDVVAALGRKAALEATPRLFVPPGAMALQPSGERRRSGSHYTPPELTRPITERTLRPVLQRFGAHPTPEQVLSVKACDPAMGSGAFLVELCHQLADALVTAWRTHNMIPKDIPPDEDEVLFARRLVARRCLYGVDKNPLAVDLSKLSLWLDTLAKDHPFTFLDHALRHGDSLVGLTRANIEAINWKAVEGNEFIRKLIAEILPSAIRLRLLICDARENGSVDEFFRLLAEVDGFQAQARLLGDVIVAAFFQGSKPKERDERRAGVENALGVWLTRGEGGAELRAICDRMRQGERPLVPFHWEIEFPEVFARDNPGFDAIVGNPPFLGGTRISTEYGMEYFSWLTTQFPPAGHLCDLVAYIFRRTYDLIREKGCIGLIATNTIAQGDTRHGGLEQILTSGGHIYWATRRFRWPGMAAVVVSIVHIQKGVVNITSSVLDGKPTGRISAHLLPGLNDCPPASLPRAPFFSAGSKIYGQGFLFDDEDSKATPVSALRAIAAKHPESSKRVFPYIGGEEVNTSPTHAASRFAINFSDVEKESDLANWPELATIVREKVKPERDQLGSNPNNTPLRRRWWAYQAHRPELYRLIGDLARVLVNSQVGNHLTFAFLPTTLVYAHTLNVFVLPTYAAFCAMQCRIHEVSARFFGSSMKDDLRYTPSDCFETFPFPDAFEQNPQLEEAGRHYYDFRAALMVRNNEGLTKTYNRFHDPDERSPDILRLRELHAAMDRAVLDAYGWTDLQPSCAFLLDYEEEEDENEAVGKRRRRPYRYRWPDEFRDEVLARLLELNRRRAGLATPPETSGPAKKGERKRGAARSKDTPDLF